MGTKPNFPQLPYLVDNNISSLRGWALHRLPGPGQPFSPESSQSFLRPGKLFRERLPTCWSRALVPSSPLKCSRRAASAADEPGQGRPFSTASLSACMLEGYLNIQTGLRSSMWSSSMLPGLLPDEHLIAVPTLSPSATFASGRNGSARAPLQSLIGIAAILLCASYRHEQRCAAYVSLSRSQDTRQGYSRAPAGGGYC